MNSHPPAEESVFETALALPASERADYLARTCIDRPDLRQRVEALLRAHDDAASLLEGSPGETARTAFIRPSVAEQPGTMIGRYKLLQLIGEGGCGLVYMAEQEEPVRRRVALKIIKLGMDTKEVVARFEAERQALAMMDHPNIARVFDGGSTPTGRPYFVMELVRGLPITRYCDQANLSTAARLSLFERVCHAVQHAHQKGIIHRDLKPSNVLVTENDGVPVPKVIDFGIAKATQGRLTDATLFTAFEQFIGTPAYMSPEQAAMTSLDVDTRSDIYSLGVLLYELLTSRTPFDAKELAQVGLDEMRRHIREVEPPKPSSCLSTLGQAALTTAAQRRRIDPPRLIELVDGDLDWIVMRCLEKDRTRRYETASNLAQDIERHLHNEPVVARPASNVYRLQKLVRRHRVACTAGAVIFVALLTGLGISVWAYFNEKAARQFAVESTMNLRKASELNQKIMIRAADNQRRADASDRQAEIDAAKSNYAMAVMQALTSGQEPVASTTGAAALIPVTDQLLADSAIRPEAKWELSEKLGDLYLKSGDYTRAEALFRAAVTLRRATQGEGNPALLPVIGKLIKALQGQGKDREAHRLQLESGHASTAFLQSGQWSRQLTADAMKLQSAGHYAEAEAKFQAATQVARTGDPERYHPIDDIGRLAWLRFEAGDFEGTKELAQHWLAAEKSSRNWAEAGPFGFFMWIITPKVIPPYDAHTLLGLIALREGNVEAARNHLLMSAAGATRRTEFDWRKLQLAAALAARGETSSVQRFLNLIRPRYVDAFEARNPENTLFFTQGTTINLAATGRLHARQLADWELDLSAGHVPVEWAAMRDTQPAHPALVGPALPPVATLSLAPAKTKVELLRPLLPFGFMMLGWCVTVAMPRLRPTRLLSPAAKGWLGAFCVLRTVECLQFTGMIAGDGYVPWMFSGLFISFFSWISLWQFVRALAPEMCPPREIRAMNVLAVVGTSCAAALSCSGFVDVGNVGLTVSIMTTLGLTLLTFTLSIATCIVAAKRIWEWQKKAALTSYQRNCLSAAAPLLLAHGFVSIFASGIHGGPPAVSESLFWACASLPWLLAVGFFGIDSHVGEPAPIQTR